MDRYLIVYKSEFVSKVNVLLDKDIIDSSITLDIGFNYHRIVNLTTEEELLIRISYPEVHLNKLRPWQI